MANPNIKQVQARKIGTVLLLVFLAGPGVLAIVDSKTVQPDGIDDAKVDIVAVQRDPFWPIGYTPEWIVGKESNGQAKVVEKEESIDWNKAMKQVAIQGVSSRAGNEFFAVINGQVRSTGETVSVQVGEVNYTWAIEGISPPSSVKLLRVSAK